jgi:hypothetical protein
VATFTGVLIIKVGVVAGAALVAVTEIGAMVEGLSQAETRTSINNVSKLNKVFFFKVEPLFSFHLPPAKNNATSRD